MVRRRPLAVIGALSAVIALQGAPVASAQVVVVGPGPQVMITELPALSELPPLPGEGEESEDDETKADSDGLTAIQTAAFVLAVGALVAGGTGLALVTLRGRGALRDDPLRRTPTPPRVDR